MIDDNKKAFAKYMVEGLDAYDAGLKVFPNDSDMSMKASLQWKSDDDVVRYTKEILNITPKVLELPTKDQHCQQLYDIFEDGSIATRDRLAASDQITRIQGFIVDKVDKNTTINNKIMIVTKALSDEEWEEKSKRNQENLMKGVIEVKAVDVEIKE